mmetsp:Transcript_32257/g.47681  ORF Transcript_32257/g.47681 Transcript_32257/m.47681 type:complete len:250 (+) Transcript_32257:181-930(+)
MEAFTLDCSLFLDDNDLYNNNNTAGGGYRHVTDKLIPSRITTTTTDTKTNDTTNDDGSDNDDHPKEDMLLLFDSFTGLLDSITGALVYGTRHYAVTGEVYEGPFHNNSGAIRHGTDAIMKQMRLSYCQQQQTNDTTTDDDALLLQEITNTTTTTVVLCTFVGTFVNDEPTEGTLVVSSDNCSLWYQGPLQNRKFHGPNGTLWNKEQQYRHVGSFEQGVFHGWGRHVQNNTTNGACCCCCCCYDFVIRIG